MREAIKKTVILVTIVILATNAGIAATEKVIYDFSLSQGFSPEDGVVFRAGHLYGTTTQGGAFSAGVVFELTRSKSAWTETILHSFSGSDGAIPVAGVKFDKEGNLYGTTSSGGAFGYGVVFKLTRSESGWTETVLYSFTGGSDGGVPIARVIFDKAGSLYSTTLFGGASGCGVVFELTPGQDGWTETVLHSFVGCSGNAHPQAGVILRGGNLYGTTYDGGTSGYGVVFELTPLQSGWTEVVLYNFTGGSDGAFPSSVIFDQVGNLYGTTFSGGVHNNGENNGVVFRLAPSQGGWIETVLYSFTGNPDGALPLGSVMFDKAGNLYGTTWSGGTFGHGTVFELTPSQPNWTETILHSFNGTSDGDLLLAGVILDHRDNLYGTTAAGGANGAGVVFEIIK